MAGSINKVILVGNVGRDPEIRHANDGSKIASFTLATNETWKDKESGERKERTEWHRIVVFNERLAEVIENYIKKGSKIYLEGQLQTRKWTDPQGMERYTTEVVLSRFRGELTMLDSKGGDTSMDSSSGLGSTDNPFASASNGTSTPRFDDLNDTLPF